MTTGDGERLREIAAVCQRFASDGDAVRIFFRDESIPAICRSSVALGLSHQSNPLVHAALEALSQSGDARLYACSSSLYVWGVGASDLIGAVTGPRGLIAFLVDDVATADQVFSY